MALGGFLSGLGTGLSNFAGSGLGQAAIGAGLGYGADRLTGGKGGFGALAGGLLGGANAFQGGSGLLEGNFGETPLGSQLFGQPAKELTGITGTPYAPISGLANTRQVAPQATQGGLMDSISGFGDRYGDTIGAAGDLAKTYGSISGGLAQRDNAKAEIEMRNRIAQLMEDEALYKRGARATTQSGITTGWDNSAFGQPKIAPSNYYTA